MWWRAWLLVGPLALVGLLLGPGVALAHNVLAGSDPADGASVDTGPARVVLRFDLPVRERLSTVTVVGPDGGRYEDGPATEAGDAVSIGVRPLGPAGRYTVGYRVVSDDGHPVSGSISFTLTKAGSGRPAGVSGPGPNEPGPNGAPRSGRTDMPALPPVAPTAPDGSAATPDGGDPGSPPWGWVVGAVLLLGVGAVLARRAGR